MQKGFRGAYLLTDRKQSQTLALSIWQSRADAMETEHSGYFRAQMDELNQMGIGEPTLEGYDVSLQSMPTALT